MAEPGELKITIDSDSWVFQGRLLPYTVRDSQLAVVHRGRVGDPPIPLPEGLYSVDIVTHTGAPTTSVVTIHPHGTTQVRIAAEGDVTASTMTTSGRQVEETTASPMNRADDRVMGAAVVTRGGRIIIPELAAAEEFEVESSELCQILGLVSGLSYEMQPIGTTPQAVPTVVFRLGSRRIEMSLPLNPEGERTELTTCIVSRVREYGRERLRMSFPPGRDLCVMLDGLLRHHAAGSVMDLLDIATTALYQKYLDSAGAALGGLTLHAMGRLHERERWVENLARFAPWLPDSRILYAALLMNDADEGERRRGLEMLLAATFSRPLYTDGLSLAMELLRRWPGDDLHEERTKRLEWLADLSATAEWDSINLSTER
jgi:hypothetical protein